MNFPLPDGYFPPLKCTAREIQNWKDEITIRLEQILAQEALYVIDNKYHSVDSTKWSFVKSKDDFRLYKPAPEFLMTQSQAATATQFTLGLGTFPGTVDDALMGVRMPTSASMRSCLPLMNKHMLDSAVLHVMEDGVSYDPFRYLGVKWRLVQTPLGSAVRNRDILFLEYVGKAFDNRGNQFGFHITIPFDHPSYPPFEPEHGIVRARPSTGVIYRQVGTDTVGVFSKIAVNMDGRIPKFLTRAVAMEVALCSLKVVSNAHAKKLTILAMNIRDRRHDQVWSRSDSTSSDDSNYNEPNQRKRKGKSSCEVCLHSVGGLSFRAKLYCDLCNRSVCSKCRNSRYLISDARKPIKVNCCTYCFMAAKSIVLDPQKPLERIPYKEWVATHGGPVKNTFSSGSFSSFDEFSEVQRPILSIECPDSTAPYVDNSDSDDDGYSPRGERDLYQNDRCSYNPILSRSYDTQLVKVDTKKEITPMMETSKSRRGRAHSENVHGNIEDKQKRMLAMYNQLEKLLDQADTTYGYSLQFMQSPSKSTPIELRRNNSKKTYQH